MSKRKIYVVAFSFFASISAMNDYRYDIFEEVSVLMNELAKKIQKQAASCGFDKCGIIPISLMDGFDELYDKRLCDVPMSKYLYENVGALKETRSRFPWAKSIVVLVFNYSRFRFPKELQGKYAKAFFLEPEKNNAQRFDLEGLEKWFDEKGIRAEGGEQLNALSIGPLKYMAMKAGLGIIRNNNFFYTEAGSYCNLFGYVIDKKCELVYESDIPPCSEKCGLCRKACKTGALEAPFTLNPFKCVSFLTTFGNCDTPEGLSDKAYGEWVCGCDDCQDACPYNIKHNWSEGEVLTALENITSDILPENFDGLSDEFIIKKVIPKTAEHLQDKDIQALRKNAARSAVNSKSKNV